MKLNQLMEASVDLAAWTKELESAMSEDRANFEDGDSFAEAQHDHPSNTVAGLFKQIPSDQEDQFYAAADKIIDKLR